MNPVHSVLARLIGRPLPESLPPVSPQTVARAETSAADEDRAAAALGATTPPRPTPTLLAKPPTSAVGEAESPGVTALRLEVQQLRLLRTPAGTRALAVRLQASESDRAALDQRVLDLQAANESLTEELRAANTRRREAEDALAVFELGPRP